MPDVRDARVRKRERHQKHSAEVGIPHSAEAGRQGGFHGRQGGFHEGPNEAIAEFTTVGRSHMQETRVTSTREGK